MSRDVLVAIVGGVFGVAVAVVGPFAANWVKRLANGRVDSARERQQFYRDLQTRLVQVEAKLEEVTKRKNELERTQVHLEALAEDVQELRTLIEEHLIGHPQVETMMALLERMAVRMGRGGFVA